MPTSFDRFAVGDVAIFERCFSQEDFTAFSRLSGDRNPLHHDATHAGRTRFGQPIVPLHLVLAPLSQIAGMVFPGEPSLYLSHEVRAPQPVYYGETLRYSARITAVNAAHRVLTVRVLALRATEIVLDAEMRVQATAESWESEAALPILHTAGPGRALVTGASGAIGGAVALALASAGWALLLQDRGDDPRRQALRAALDRLGASVDFVAADLTSASGRTALAAAVTERGDVEIVVHAASPGVTAPLDELVAVNYRAFKEITDAALPAMLARQKGRLLFIGSTAILRGLPGWEDYAAAKAMGSGLASGLDNRFSGFGVRGLVLMPGYVATAFSAETRGDNPALLPQEVAAVALEMVESPDATAVLLEVGRRDSGRLGLAVSQDARRAVPPIETAPGAPAATEAAPASASIEDAVRQVLRLPRGTPLAGGGMGITPEWDSLRQIEIVLALESTLGVQFSSAELGELNRFDSLLAACTRKQADK